MLDRWKLKDFLKLENRFMTEKEIVIKTNTSQPSINKKLNSLVKGKSVVVEIRETKRWNRKMKIKYYKFVGKRK